MMLLLACATLCRLGALRFAPPRLVDNGQMPTDFLPFSALDVNSNKDVRWRDAQVVLGREFNTESMDAGSHWAPSSPGHFSSVIHFFPKQRAGGSPACNVTTVGGVLAPAASADANASSSTGPFISTKMSRRLVVTGPSSNGSFAAVTLRGPPTLRFTGALPRPSKCWGELGCMRMGGSTSIAVPAAAGGGVLMTTLVQWGGHSSTTCNTTAPIGMLSCNQTSVVVWFAADGKETTWQFRGVLADAFDHPESLEGPNEHDIVLLADGVTLLAVVRLDGGDGGLKPPRQPYTYLNYYRTLSTDWGRTWSQLQPISNAGCARPRLLQLGSSLLMSGGRYRTHGNTSDVLLWESLDGYGASWRPYSLSYQHNHLAVPGTPLFTADVNFSGPLFTLPRQTNAYTSLVRLNDSAALVFYDQRFRKEGGSATLSKSFSMVVTVEQVPVERAKSLPY